MGEALGRGKGRVGGRWEVSEIDRSVGSLVNVRGMLDHMVCCSKKIVCKRDREQRKNFQSKCKDVSDDADGSPSATGCRSFPIVEATHVTIYLRLAKANSRGEKNKARGASLGTTNGLSSGR